MASESRTDPAAASRAVALHRGWETVIAEREAVILDNMVDAYRAGKATGEMLIAKIAAISELRHIEGTLDRQARLSIEQANAAIGGQHG